jgi:hypothetical protein
MEQSNSALLEGRVFGAGPVYEERRRVASIRFFRGRPGASPDQVLEAVAR